MDYTHEMQQSNPYSNTYSSALFWMQHTVAQKTDHSSAELKRKKTLTVVNRIRSLRYYLITEHVLISLH